ncbi:B-cell receptor CD22-like [Salminus brasiliensis]|uniref:B-cell receptor CD22-like n=1 Tax=Salminus brasiliensis TaxID=930266 RepID=UPI003B83527F
MCLTMSIQMTIPLLSLAVIWGASGAEWRVKYNQQEICALNRSTVFMNGTFTLPDGLNVTETFWIIDPVKGTEPTDLSKVPEYSGRVKDFSDNQKQFSLKLSNVTKKDEKDYYFRILTNVADQKWLGKPGVTLKVTELHVESPGEMTERETADLTCKTTCSLNDPTFIWYKNERPLTTKTIKNNQLHLQTVSSEDAGRYSCAIRGSEHLPSTSQTLRVRYPPKSVSVSISPSCEIVEGSSVTLTCSSDANPPVKIYTWFKGSSSVGKGETYSFTNISSEDSGGYTCLSRNELGERNSTAVYLNVLYPPRNVSVSISPSGETVEGSSVTLTCSSDANPPVEINTWFKEGGSSPVGSGRTYSPLQNGSYYCQAQNQHGAQNATAVSVSIRDLHVESPGEVTEGESAVLTCKTTCSLTEPTFIWFKNERPLTTMTIKNNQLHLQTVSSEDAGRNWHTEIAEATMVTMSPGMTPPLPLVFLLMILAESVDPSVTSSSLHQHTGKTLVSISPSGEIVEDQPRHVSVSISPSGEIVEGSSVTLTCSSDANPPVKIYNWFKKSKEIAGKGQNVYIPKIRSEDRGEYKCISTNKYGNDQSPAVCLDVLYPPKSVSVSITQIVEGSSVTLTCSSDSNPPVKNYTWFEEGGSSPVGSGNTYSIINITMEDKRRFYCKAQNKIGSQTSSAVSVLEPTSLNVSPGQPSVSSTEEHTQYASIKFHQDTDGTKKSGNDHAPCSQLGAGDAKDHSVIYSSVKKHK